jgi:hypothetical protein
MNHGYVEDYLWFKKNNLRSVVSGLQVKQAYIVVFGFPDGNPRAYGGCLG